MEYKKNNQVKILSLGNIDYSKCVDLQKKLQKEIIDIKLFNRKNNLNKLFTLFYYTFFISGGS